MNKKLMSIIVCPLCKGGLYYQRRTKELICVKDKLAFPVHNGMPVLLVCDARPVNT